jgi:glycosyltransferase involved in cell wall biosynthesis
MGGNFTVKNFSVVVPVYNEEDIVLQSAAQIYDICKRKQLEFEIIFVENGSEDNTLSLIDEFISDKKECRVISLKLANYGNALKQGFIQANNEIVISFDIDYFSEDFLNQALGLERTLLSNHSFKKACKVS